MKKTRLIHKQNLDLWEVITNDKRCYYLVSFGDVKIKRNGDIDDSNIFYFSRDLNECLKYIDIRGNK